ncbi:molybdenum cofactor guanylyltransferase [Halorussus salinisoli]|uniref:molybdenum cofactor guanylyltransferase n=1 Tax=Halorussus salinisoli TaxID=2558242 RepID=UPI0010C1B5BD|nr:molybdenum cofactor guanylyltransferase [Halorussus salinisoli]
MTPEMETDDLTGVVLAGGYSRRFGDCDKALARLGGRPLLARVVARLGEAADRVVVNCRTDQREAFADALGSVPVPIRFAPDSVPDRGPLFGFRAALRAVETANCALVACDAPFLDPRLLSALAERLDDDPDAEAAAVRTEGRLHPTQAVYRTARARQACDALLDGGEARLSALFDRLDARSVPAESAAGNAGRSLFDVDTPADREQAVEMLGEAGEASSPERQREVSAPR